MERLGEEGRRLLRLGLLPGLLGGGLAVAFRLLLDLLLLVPPLALPLAGGAVGSSSIASILITWPGGVRICARRAARAITWSSSRTFPGHSPASRTAVAAAVSPTLGSPSCAR